MPKKIFLAFALAALPVLASAQLTKTTGILDKIKSIVTDILIPLVFILAVLFFFWGLAKYVWSVSSTGKDEGKQIMIWGVIALFVMTSIWGLVSFLQGELNIDKGAEGKIPTIKK